MCSPLLPEGLSFEILEMLIGVNQVRPWAEGIVAVLEAARNTCPLLQPVPCFLLLILPAPERGNSRFQDRFLVKLLFNAILWLLQS